MITIVLYPRPPSHRQRHSLWQPLRSTSAPLPTEQNNSLFTNIPNPSYAEPSQLRLLLDVSNPKTGLVLLEDACEQKTLASQHTPIQSRCILSLWYYSASQHPHVAQQNQNLGGSGETDFPELLARILATDPLEDLCSSRMFLDEARHVIDACARTQSVGVAREVVGR